MHDLALWLTAQLAEDERIARAAMWCEDAAAWHAAPSPFDTRGADLRWYVEDAMDDGVITHVDPKASDDEGVARHIAEHDPARVLREIEAKWRTLIRCQEEMLSGIPRLVHFARQTLREMALGYSHRAGYVEAIDG